jgi:hypothetical protein
MTDEKFIKRKSYYADTFDVASSDDKKMENLARSLPSIHQTTISIYFEEVYELKQLKVELDKTYAEGFKHYKVDNNRDYTAKEIEIMMNQNVSYIKIKRKYNDQEMKAKYFEATLDNIKKTGFSVSSWIKIKAFMQGDQY